MTNFSFEVRLEQYIQTLIGFEDLKLGQSENEIARRARGFAEDWVEESNLFTDYYFLYEYKKKSCPSSQLLLAYAIKSLGEDREIKIKVKQHLAQCEKCNLYVDGLNSPLHNEMNRKILNVLKEEQGGHIVDILDEYSV